MRCSNLIRSAALAFLALGSLAATPAHAQFGGSSSQPLTQVHDPSALRPPAGARVAIVEFEDMECPVCGNINPLVKQAVAKYNLPWIRHDFPLPYHAWSTQAAVNARWFDAKSKLVVSGLLDIADLLTPEQRTQLAAEIEHMRSMGGGPMGGPDIGPGKD